MRSFLSIRLPIRLRAHLVVRKHFYFFVWLLTLLDSGGVEDFQQDYAFTAWASSASPFKHSSLSSFWLNHSAAAINGNVNGVLEYLVSEQ